MGLCTAHGSGSVSISIYTGQLYDFNQSVLPDGALVLLIADTSQNGFGSLLTGSQLSVGSFLNADDQILGTALIDTDSFAPGSTVAEFDAISLSTGIFSTLTSNDPLAIVWFSFLDGSSTNISTGDTYGLFTGGLTPLEGTSPWIVPSSGSALIELFFKTEIADGPYPESAAYATFTVGAIPEPATYASFLGAAALGFVAYRKRRHA